MWKSSRRNGNVKRKAFHSPAKIFGASGGLLGQEMIFRQSPRWERGQKMREWNSAMRTSRRQESETACTHRRVPDTLRANRSGRDSPRTSAAAPQNLNGPLAEAIAALARRERCVGKRRISTISRFPARSRRGPPLSAQIWRVRRRKSCRNCAYARPPSMVQPSISETGTIGR